MTMQELAMKINEKWMNTDTDDCLEIFAYEQGRADAIDECKYNVELFREIFLEELERQAVDREEIFMYRNICSMSWNKYFEQLKEQKSTT